MTRSALQPLVCDCATQPTACTPPSDDETPSYAAGELYDHEEYDDDEGRDVLGDEEIVEADISSDDDDDYASNQVDVESASAEGINQAVSPEYRTLRRQGQPSSLVTDSNNDELQPVDSIYSDGIVDLTSARMREIFENRHGVSIPERDDIFVFSGSFLANRADGAAFYIPGESLRIYNGGQLISERKFSSHETVDITINELPAHAAYPIQLVKNKGTQILVHYSEQLEDGTTLYKVAIHKLIAGNLGTIFERTLAVKSPDTDDIRIIGSYRILKGKNHRYIEWQEYDNDGEPYPTNTILKWNRWEGVYRPPGPPPTAPRRQS